MEQLEALRRQYAEQLPEKIAELERAWASVEGGDDDGQALETVYRGAHGLAGSGTTFGFPGVTDAARTLEELLFSVIEADAGLTDEHGSRVEGLLAELRRAARAPVPGEGDEVSLARDRASAQETRSILLVDDDAEQAQALAAEIRQFGYAVEVVCDTGGIGQAVERAAPAAIVMDVAFPGGKDLGIEAVERLRRAGSGDIPVVFVSGRGDFEARLGAVRAGGEGYLVKPFDALRLIERLDRLTAVAPPEPYRILVVEDDRSLASQYAAVLASAGMVAEVANHARQVIERQSDFDAELILLDLYLPDCSGLELAKMIRQQEALAGVPIVFLSTEARIDRQLVAMSLGGDDFLTKPIAPKRLLAAVTSRVQRARVVRALMVRDSLTGMLNHASLLEHLGLEAKRAERGGAELAFALLDLDRFKSVNDTYGHGTGDRVIKGLSRLLGQRLRQTDILGRYGGEEFGVIFIATSAARAAEIADELRRAFARQRFGAESGEFSVTFSCGIAGFPAHQSAGALMEAADKALYEAKRAGRNRVVLAEAPA